MIFSNSYNLFQVIIRPTRTVHKALTFPTVFYYICFACVYVGGESWGPLRVMWRGQPQMLFSLVTIYIFFKGRISFFLIDFY